jgi:hypothetical protein
MVAAYVAAEKPPIQKVWYRSKEAALQALKQTPQIEDTSIGTKSRQMAQAGGNNLAILDPEMLALLKQSIEHFEENQNPNAGVVV